jgi:hypothetical protein
VSNTEDSSSRDEYRDRDLIASMNESNSFEELETLTRMAHARLNRRGGEPAGSRAARRLRRVLPFSPGA